MLAASLSLALFACSSEAETSSRSTAMRAESTTTRVGQVVASTSAVPEGAALADPGEAASAVDEARAALPYPADVLECVAGRASADAEVFEALKSPGEGKRWPLVQAAAAACVVEVRSGPRFAEDLQRASGGKLSGEQVACAAREYGKLSPEQIEAAAGAVMNPGEAEPSATAPIEAIYAGCGIDPVGG